MIYFKKLHPAAIIPTRAHPDDAGFDLYTDKLVALLPGEWCTATTGIACAIEWPLVGLVCPRSGLASKIGLTVLNAPGIIDAGYRGEIKVILKNTAPYPVRLKEGDRMAQLVLTAFFPDSEVVDELPPSLYRQENGFGSTGA